MTKAQQDKQWDDETVQGLKYARQFLVEAVGTKEVSAWAVLEMKRFLDHVEENEAEEARFKRDFTHAIELARQVFEGDPTADMVLVAFKDRYQEDEDDE